MVSELDLSNVLRPTSTDVPSRSHHSGCSRWPQRIAKFAGAVQAMSRSQNSAGSRRSGRSKEDVERASLGKRDERVVVAVERGGGGDFFGFSAVGSAYSRKAIQAGLLMLETSWKGLSICRMHSLKGDLVSLRLAYDNKDKALNQSTIQHRQWEKTENGTASWGQIQPNPLRIRDHVQFN